MHSCSYLYEFMYTCIYVCTEKIISDECLMENTDLPGGGNLKEISYTTTSECKKACEAENLCVAYTSTNSSRCILRSNAHAAESVVDGWISARMSCYEGI